VVEQILWVAQATSSYREAAEAMERLAGIAVSKSTIHRQVAKYGKVLVEKGQQEAQEMWESGVTAEPREEVREEVGISLDGVKVWVDGGWHEVKVGCCFDFGPGEQGEVKAKGISYVGWYGEVEEFRMRMWWHAYHHGMGLDGKGVVIGDGATWIDGFVQTYCPDGVRIVDWYHAMEHLWALGREAYGDEGASEWVKKVEEKLWAGEVEEVVLACEQVLRERQEWSEAAQRVPGYFHERAEQMRYPTFRAAGYPIGSGTVESECKGLGWRCKGRGQRWKEEGLQAIIALRSAGMSGSKEWKWAWEQMTMAA